VSVCVCVCLSDRISPETCALFTGFSVHVAYGRGSVLLQQGDKILRGRGSFGDFSTPLTMHCSAFTANNVMQQKGSFRRRREVMGMHSTGEV